MLRNTLLAFIFIFTFGFLGYTAVKDIKERYWYSPSYQHGDCVQETGKEKWEKPEQFMVDVVGKENYRLIGRDSYDGLFVERTQNMRYFDKTHAKIDCPVDFEELK